MSWSLSLSLRAVALLRRIAKALEHSNRLAEEQLALDHPQRMFIQKRGGRPSRVVEVSVPNLEDWNSAYRKDHPELEYREPEEPV